MFKLSLKNILSRKGRLVLTALAVIAGTAFLSGVFVFSDTIKGSFDRMFASAYKDTDAIVRSSTVIKGDIGGDTRDHISADVLDKVRAVPGVKEAVAGINASAAITFKGDVVGQDGPPKYGAVWTGSAYSPWSLKEGNPPNGPNEVVIDGASSKLAKIKVGDTVTVATFRTTQDFKVVGIAKFAGSDSTGGASFALFDLGTAQQFLLGDTTKIDEVYVVGDGSMTQRELADKVQAALADPMLETRTGAEIIKENQTTVQESLGFLTTFLTIFAVISMFVGSFIIYNVFTISAAQRERENALLRAVGASRSQVTRSMFVEALVVGIGGSLLGCVGGIGLAATIMAVLGKLGFGPGDTTLTLKSNGFIVTLIAGVVVTLVCAISPAIRSGRVPPLAAMRDVSVDRSAVSVSRKVVGAGSVLLAIVAVALGLRGQVLWLGIGVVALFVALIALGPFVAAPIARIASPILGRFRGAAGTMAGRNAARNPKRTAITAGALAVGLSLMIGIATVGSSATASLRKTLGDSFVGDYIITPKQQQSGFLPAQLSADVKAAGLGDVLTVGFSPVQLGADQDDTMVVAIEPGAAAELFTFKFLSGGFADLDTNGVLLQQSKADDLGVELGGTVPITLVDGTTHDLTVRGIYDTAGFTDVLLNRAVFGATADKVFDIQLYVKASGGESAATTAALKAIVAEYPTAKFQTREGFIQAQEDQLNGFLNFIYALLGMSIFIAVIGIVITLWLSVWERRRELGLLRAVGMTRRQVRSSVLWESMITGVVGVVMGLLLGTSLGWIIVKALSDQGLSVFELPLPTMVVTAVVALLLAALAAVLPARKAARSDVLEAIATT